MGRRVYWRCVVLVVMALRQRRPESLSAGRMVRMFDISRKTLTRWFGYIREAIAQSHEWQRARGLVSPYVTDDRLPASLLDYCIESTSDALSGLVACCRLLAGGR
jgi:predicted DNA-binding transcriptional regulator YafY